VEVIDVTETWLDGKISDSFFEKRSKKLIELRGEYDEKIPTNTT